MAKSKASVYNLMLDYSSGAGGYISTSPYWVLAVIRLGAPVTFSRSKLKSVGSDLSGGHQRKEAPLIITDDCISLSINASKRSHVKTLTATLKNSGVNYLSSDAILPGDWVFAWVVNGEKDFNDLLSVISDLKPANYANSGLKFVGRLHNIRKIVSVEPNNGNRSVAYSIQCLGFDELDTQFYYSAELAHTAVAKGELANFLGDMGGEIDKILQATRQKSGEQKNNISELMTVMFDSILGKGLPRVNEAFLKGRDNAINLAKKTGAANDFDKLNGPAPQQSKEAPFSYLVPIGAGLLLGLSSQDKSKKGVFGYSDICETLFGVHKYEVSVASIEKKDSYSSSFYPKLGSKTRGPRKYTDTDLKGTIIPVEINFLNRPLWQILQSYLNTAINEMYTALKVNDAGNIMPTVVARQIPFSTDAAEETEQLPLSKFLNQPRWRIDPSMVYSLDIGRSNATRINMVHVYGSAQGFATDNSVVDQMVRNPPIFDKVDIQRSGIRAMMKTVNCAVTDQLESPKSWMAAIADWTFGSQLTLNGTLNLIGVQAPIAEGDNVEFEGVVYHIESVRHTCSIEPSSGRKSWNTQLELSYGMPADQGDFLEDFPRYPGITNTSETKKFALSSGEDVMASGGVEGDNGFSTSQDPGITALTKFSTGK